MPTLDELWNSSGSTTGGKPDASLDDLWDKSKAQPPNKGTFLHPVKPTEPGWGSVGERIMQYPGLIAGKVADALKSGPQLMGDVAAGRVDPTSREGVGRAFDVAATFSPAAPQRGGVLAAGKAVARPPPSRSELFDEADKLYFDLRQSSVPLAKADVDTFSSRVRQTLNDRGFYHEDQPQTFRALERLKNPVGDNSSAKEVYAARTSLNNAVRDNPGKSESAAAAVAMEELDGFLSQIPGFAETAAKARGNYRGASQSQRVDSAVERGTLNAGTSGTGANLDNALRQRIKALLIDKRVQKTPEEAALMKEISTGGTGGNIARLFSKLGPQHPLTGWGSAIAADFSGGHGLATISLGAGALAQHIAERSTSGKIQRLDEMIRRNTPLGRTPLQPQKVVRPPMAGSALAPAAGSALAQPEDALQ
jgi:hypothetical protein